ncbi:MAG: hypothetical protein K2X47_11650 [Bdellovibrionales bacterium]|nr:hypothetical protein [Bdellovibrionales bacterium]
MKRSLIVSALSTLMLFLLLGFQNCGSRLSFSGDGSDKNLSKMPVGNEIEAGRPDEEAQERAEDEEPNDNDEDDEDYAKNPEKDRDDDYDTDLSRCDQDPRDRSSAPRVAKSINVKTDQLYIYAKDMRDRRLFGRLLKIEDKARDFDVLSLRKGIEITIPASVDIKPSKPKWLLFHLGQDGHEIVWSDNSKENLGLSRSFLRNEGRFLRVLVKKRSSTEVEAGKTYIAQIEKLCLKHVVKRSRTSTLQLRKRVIRQRATVVAK